MKLLFVDEVLINNLKKLKDNNEVKFSNEIKKVKKELFNNHCSKIGYKDECDPFCADAFTDTCIYLKEMRKLWDVFGREW